MTIMETQLSVSVRDHPHWRVNLRPGEYNEELISSLSLCLETIEKTTVRLRGLPYPYLSPHDTSQERGANWVASWLGPGGQEEYWRFYQSGQFVHLFSVREAVEPGFREELERRAHEKLGLYDKDWAEVPGFISIPNFIYTVTEIFEFAARLCQKGIYRGTVRVSIKLEKIKGFTLMAGRGRAWWKLYSSGTNKLEKTWELQSDGLVANSANHSLEAILWFFERFGWDDPSIEIIKNDQQDLLQGRL